jgi:peroxiredoxin Q/BCP
VIGISVDTLDDQRKFAEKENLTYPLLADPDKKVARAFGVLTPAGYAQRATFVIDKDGVVRKIYPRVADPRAHADEVLAHVKENLAGKK